MSARCWSCDAEIGPDSVEKDGILVPRQTSEGGPLWLLPCPGCGTENGAERNAAGEFLLVPSVDPGIGGWFDSLLDRDRATVRARAQAWFLRNEERRAAFHRVPRRRRRRVDPSSRESEKRDPDLQANERPEPAGEARPGRETEREASDGGRDRETHVAPSAEVDALLEHYEVLDLPLTATRKEISASYRRLSQKCHPDKVAHLDHEFQDLAERKFRRLRRAYEALAESRSAREDDDPAESREGQASEADGPVA